VTIIILGAVLLFAGIAGAQQPLPLPAATIPQFVEPLPLLEFEFINATSIPDLGGVLTGLPPMGEHCVTPDPLGPNGCACVPDTIDPPCLLDANGNPIPDMVPTTPFPVNAEEFRSQILPSLAIWPAAPLTCGLDTASSVWGYISDPALLGGIRQTYLGPLVIADSGVTASPVYGNNLPENGLVQQNLPIDQTLDWADPDGAPCDINSTCLDPYTGPIPIATHLHGGEVAPAYDGGPDAWFTQDLDTITVPDYTGPGYPGAQYEYPNNQQEGTIWFHDHALGITRLNVYAGLAGLMPIIDPDNPPLTTLPNIGDGFDIPLIIQDRTFDNNCEILYNLASNPQPNPTVHPFWIPEFIGDTIVVNGKTWPFLNVEPRQYRLRFVNGSNARFYELTIKSNDDPVTGALGTKLPFLAIATDDGYLMNAVSTNMVVIGPGERYEVVVDFRGLLPGRLVTMFNSARTPYPGDAKPIKGLTDRVMQFKVVSMPVAAPASTNVAAGSPLRDPVDNPIHPIVTAHDPLTGSITRQLTLNEVIGPGGPLELVVNNSRFNLAGILPGCTTTFCRETELPAVGGTEIWEIINISADAHPMPIR
jgi:spore coat protein A